MVTANESSKGREGNGLCACAFCPCKCLHGKQTLKMPLATWVPTLSRTKLGEEKETETLCVPLLGRATASVPALPLPGLGISLYCSSLLHTPQASLPLPSSLETVQPPNDPNNHTRSSLCFFAKNESESIGDFKKQPKCLWTRGVMVELCQMQNNHYLPPRQ